MNHYSSTNELSMKLKDSILKVLIPKYLFTLAFMKTVQCLSEGIAAATSPPTRTS